MKNKKLVKLLAMMLASCTLLSACGQSASGQPEAESAKTDAEDKASEETAKAPADSAAEVEKDYSGVEIEAFFLHPWVNVEPTGEDVLADRADHTYGFRG